MTSDIELARRSRLRIARRAAREQWLSRLSFEVTVTWPRGVLGCACGLLLLLAPPLLVAIVTRSEAWLRRMWEPGGGGPNSGAA